MQQFSPLQCAVREVASYKSGRGNKGLNQDVQIEMPSKKYGTIQELGSTFNHIKFINIDFNLVWLVWTCEFI